MQYRRTPPPSLEKGTAGVKKICHNPLLPVICMAAPAPGHSLSYGCDLFEPHKMSEWINWGAIQDIYDINQSWAHIYFISEHKLYESCMTWIPWNLSFRYILFHEKKLQTMLWHHNAIVNSHQRLLDFLDFYCFFSSWQNWSLGGRHL